MDVLEIGAAAMVDEAPDGIRRGGVERDEEEDATGNAAVTDEVIDGVTCDAGLIGSLLISSGTESVPPSFAFSLTISFA